MGKDMDIESMCERARLRAEQLYAVDDLNCGESVFKAVLEAFGEPCPLSLLRVASALGTGMNSGCSCGALTGGELAIGCLLGREQETGSVPKDCKRAAKRCHAEFVRDNRAACCRILTKGMVHDSPERRQACAGRSAAAAGRAVAIIADTLAERRAREAAGS